jgi:AraC-like DNA-binding protein
MSRATVVITETEQGWTETAIGVPAALLRPYFQSYYGYREAATGIVRRLEVPFPRAALILGFGEPIAVANSANERDLEPGYRAFLAGLSTGPALVESYGGQAGIQVDLTPLGARHVFGTPMGVLTDRVVHLEDLLGRPAIELMERLRDSPGWDARYDLLDRVFLAAVAANPGTPAPIAWAWQQIATARDGVRVARLAEEVGWSHKHFISRFREEVGLAPRLASRVVRFDRAVSAVRTGTMLDWSALAAEAGYYDQAHMARDFREFARCTPGEFLARQLPDGGTRGDGIGDAADR